MAATDHATLLGMLQRGLTVGQMATELGVTPSAVSQALAAAPELAELAARHRAQAENRAQALDDGWDAVELLTQKRLTDAMRYETNPARLAMVAKIANSARRRGAVTPGSEQHKRRVVTVVMPAAIQGKIVLNEQKEVVEVNGRAMVTMPAGQVLKLREAHQRQEEENERAKLTDVI